jgi:hypothetical protein
MRYIVKNDDAIVGKSTRGPTIGEVAACTHWPATARHGAEILESPPPPD